MKLPGLYWCCLFLTGFLPMFSAQEQLTLQEGLSIGLDNNYAIRIIRNEQQIAENNFTLGNAGYLPTLDLTTGYSGTANDIRQEMPDGETTKYNNINNQNLNTGLNLNWTVFDGFQIQAQYQRLKELEAMGELNTRLVIEDFIAEFSTEYYNNVRQNLRLKNLRYAVSLSKERLRIVEARYGIGSLSRLDLQQARVDFNADSSNLIKQYEVVYTSRIRLNQLMALQDIDRPLQVADTLIEFNPFLNEDLIWQNMLIANSSLLLAAKNKTLSEMELKIYQSRNYPYLQVNAGYGFTRNVNPTASYDSQRTYGFNYGVTLGFNIFDGFNKNRQQKNARIEIQNRELQYQQLELALKADLSNIWMAYENNMDLTGLEKENLENARENYEIAIERYKLGELSGLELREAQNSLLEAEERLLESQYNTKLCEISLLLISGQVTYYLE